MWDVGCDGMGWVEARMTLSFTSKRPASRTTSMRDKVACGRGTRSPLRGVVHLIGSEAGIIARDW